MSDGDRLTARPGARVLVLGDTHGELDVRIAALAARCDAVVHTGDVGDAAVLDTLHERAPVVVAVRGNNDVPGKWPGAAHAVLDRLPERAELALPGGMLVVVHGDGHGTGERRHARLRREFRHARLVTYGHSHQALVDRAAWPLVVNPGAAGRVRTFGGPSCALLTAAADGRWTVRLRRYRPAPAR